MSVYNESSMYNGQDPVDTEVHHDSTLSGDGSAADPLSVNFPATNVEHDSTLSGDGSSADPLSVNFPATNVAHDSTLSGDGSSADPLSVNFPATNVAHDSTLSGDGSSADPLSVNFPATNVAHDSTLSGDGSAADPLKVYTLYNSCVRWNASAGRGRLLTYRYPETDTNCVIVYLTAFDTSSDIKGEAILKITGRSDTFVAKMYHLTGTHLRGYIDIEVTVDSTNKQVHVYCYSTHSVWMFVCGTLLFVSSWAGAQHAVNLERSTASLSTQKVGSDVIIDSYSIPYTEGSGAGSANQPVYVNSDGRIKECPKTKVVAHDSSFNLNNTYTGTMIGETVVVVNGNVNGTTITVDYIDYNQLNKQISIPAGMCVSFVCTDPSINTWAGNKSI